MLPGFEIDFLPVGTGERAGDAIVLRYGDLFGSRQAQRVVVVDGGFGDTGQNVVDFVRANYRTDTVDTVVSTHPDSDHSAGLAVVLEQLKVGRLWMHLPWNHTDDMARMFRDGRVTDESVSVGLRRALDDARDLERIATPRGISIVEPFAGVGDGAGLVVLGPTQPYYESLLPHFRSTPEPRRTLAAILGIAGEAESVFESLAFETLTDEGQTSAENNSSVILWLSIGDKNALLTGDAGVPALTNALGLLDYTTIPNRVQFSFVQVPHHGSRRNVGPTILNRMVGEPIGADVARTTAFVSSPLAATTKHPSKRVTNAFRRRGALVHGTSGVAKRHAHNAPGRAGYGASIPIPFHACFEE
jgi:beta-lactamase superfamily II metal-dependent hydrolase